MKNLILSLILSVCGLFGFANAADLTTQQMQALKALALADQTASTYLSSGNDTALTDWFNTTNTKIVWRSTITPDLMRDAMVCGAAQLDGLTAGKRDSLFWLADGVLINNATLRASLDDLTGSQNTLKACIVAAEKRTATRAEAALATGTGTMASPATLGWEGYISIQNTVDIRSQ